MDSRSQVPKHYIVRELKHQQAPYSTYSGEILVVQLAQARDLEAVRLSSTLEAHQSILKRRNKALKLPRKTVLVEQVVRTWHAFRLHHGERFIDFTSKLTK